MMGSGGGEEVRGWEMRPGGMLVQRRSADPEASAAPPQIRVRVAYGPSRYEITIGFRSTFGELKKLLSEHTGLQLAEQKLMFKGKERGNAEYLDMCGVKDKAKMVLVEDPSSLERRYVEMWRNAKIETTHRAISSISLEVDKLADQVTVIAKSISNGSKVAEVQITTLIELLMRQAVKLDGILAEGDTLSQKNLQAKRVQKCVETLDVLKITNAKVKPVVVTTKWEIFDPPAMTHHETQWEFFD